jgi:Flp pilus assembly protein TadD
VEARVLRARLELDRSRLAEAAAWLEAGPSEHAGLARMRGQLALRRGQLESAVEQFRIAARLDPTNLEVTQALALTLGRLGRAAEAAAERERADRLRALANLLERAHSPDGRKDRTMPRQLAAACERIGRIPEALGWYRLAIDLDPLDAEAQSAVYRLRQSGP